MRTMIQADFYPNGRIDYFYDDGSVVTIQADTNALTPKQALLKRLEDKRIADAITGLGLDKLKTI